MSKTSIIPEGVTLEGDIEGRGDLVVAGTVDGPIDIEGALLIEDGAQVRGDVAATSIRVRGVVAGTLTASESIVVEPTAIVVGDARAARVQIVDGARFRGRVQMTAEPVPRRRRRRKDRSEHEDRSDHEDRSEEAQGEALRSSEMVDTSSSSEDVDTSGGSAPFAADTIPGTLRAPSPEVDPPLEETRVAASGDTPPESAERDTDEGPPKKRRRGRRRRGRGRGKQGDRDTTASDRPSEAGESSPRRTRRRPSRASEPQAAAPDHPRAAPSSKRRPPPPTIPSVSRQKVRRKDRGEPSP